MTNTLILNSNEQFLQEVTVKVPTPKEYLDSLMIHYDVLPHPTTFTAQHTAQAAHIKGKTLSKTIVVGHNNALAMVVVPANCILLQKSIARLLRSPDIKIVPEFQFKDRFPECEIGAMPPFGNLYSMTVLIAKELTQQETITFNAGSHSELIKMKTSDYLSITNAKVISVGYKVSGVSHSATANKKAKWQWV